MSKVNKVLLKSYARLVKDCDKEVVKRAYLKVEEILRLLQYMETLKTFDTSSAMHIDTEEEETG